MKNFLRNSIWLPVFCFIFIFPASAQQIPQATMLKIVRAEDERRFDADLQGFLKSPDARIRQRAALAAGRIGDEKAVPILAELLEKDANAEVRMTAAFALGETEAKTAADAVLKSLAKTGETDAVFARSLEAAGKIAAAIAQTDKEKSAALGEAILDALEAEYLKTNRRREVVLSGITAALRARADETEVVVGKFLSDKDARIRADALNCLARLRAKSDDLKSRYRSILLTDEDAVVRANAARALGAAEDAQSLDLLIEAAVTDDDSRVRVAAVRSLAALKDKRAAAPLLERGEKLLADYKTAKAKFPNPAEKNELLEIAATLGRVLQNSNDERAFKFLAAFSNAEDANSPEIEISTARLSPEKQRDFREYDATIDWQTTRALAQGAGELSNLNISEFSRRLAINNLYFILSKSFDPKTANVSKNELTLAIPDVLRAYATFKTENLNSVLREYLSATDPNIRATAAELLSEQPAAKENVEALKTAFAKSLLTDKDTNDAQLAILDALWKLDKREAVGSLLIALDAPDYLVRRKAFQLLGAKELEKDFPGIPTTLARARARGKDRVLPYAPAFGTRLGQILNTNADYVRAISRRNGQTKAVVTTEKGAFTIEFLPEDAPLTVDNFVQLAKRGYFNGIAFHRVVPNFVVQGGDPRGDGNGGPGSSIRCEINFAPYERGAVGMALSGKDTGGSQWFVTHSPQPHLDGGYTVFGRVNDAGLKIVDSIARGDKILRIQIVEGNAPLKSKRRK